jgi:hypothetical protein
LYYICGCKSAFKEEKNIMKIKLITTKTTESEIDIDLPFFCKQESSGRVYKVYQVKDEILWDSIFNTPTYKSIQFMHCTEQNWGEMLVITEWEYNNTFNSLIIDLQNKQKSI